MSAGRGSPEFGNAGALPLRIGDVDDPLRTRRSPTCVYHAEFGRSRFKRYERTYGDGDLTKNELLASRLSRSLKVIGADIVDRLPMTSY